MANRFDRNGKKRFNLGKNNLQKLAGYVAPRMQYIPFLIILLSFFSLNPVRAQQDSTENKLQELQKFLKQSEQVHYADSIKKAELLAQLNLLKSNEKSKKENILSEYAQIDRKDSVRKAQMHSRIISLKNNATGYPVTLLNDTLFYIYTKIGASTAQDRATNISRRLHKLYDDDFLNVDSLVTEEADNTIDLVYGETIIMSISELDALWHYQNKTELAEKYVGLIKQTIIRDREENSLYKLAMRIGLVILVVAGILVLIWLINKGYSRAELFVRTKGQHLKGLTYNDYTFLSAEQKLNFIFVLLNLLRWFLIILLLYLVLPGVFSIFPFTRGWANVLFSLVWFPFKGIFVAIWNYLPNLFSILVIVFVMHYFIKFVKYIFKEIDAGELKITGFYTDWAMPTFSIVRFLLYAFMFVLIFPYLPGSESNIFKGVSVFLGVLLSLGSSSAIANMIAGLVITYMRPFKIGDRIRIGEMSGDVIEKTLLITRLRTVKNEEITIPNSAILSGNTLNYSAIALTKGLIVHTTVTIGYDVPWKQMHEALIEAALRTDLILPEPKPFVLQTSLDDFYVSYQLNAYTHDSYRQAYIYSEMHKHIQDVCNEKGIEIMSPHYRTLRDGNQVTIPTDYLHPDYKAPAFKVDVKDSQM